MKFEKIDKKEEGKFITRYDITYKTVDDTTKIYEMISRNRNVQHHKQRAGYREYMVRRRDEERYVLYDELLPSA